MSTAEQKIARKWRQEWLLLMHLLPPQPDSFRVKVWRSLQRSGAVSIKNSVYVLPKNERAEANLARIITEIETGGGEAFLCDAFFIQGIDDDTLRRQFNTERDAAYKALEKDAAPLLTLFDGKKSPSADKLMKIEHAVGRLRRQLNEVIAIDYFSAAGRRRAESSLTRLEKKISRAFLKFTLASSPGGSPSRRGDGRCGSYRGRPNARPAHRKGSYRLW